MDGGESDPAVVGSMNSNAQASILEAKGTMAARGKLACSGRFARG